mgnify:CR=1 FL=1
MMIAVVIVHVGGEGTLRHTAELVKYWENQRHELFLFK